ncbi:MAG: hemerythrin family protein [Alteromonadaceae bacterium]|nr:hemerythrin family protein [Alteromonadaceae bacterium]
MRELLKCLDKFHKQHHEIATLIHDLEDISGDCLDYNLVDKAIEELFSYVKEHFRYEEQIMLKFNYPNIKQHLAQHNEFIETVDKLCFGSPEVISDPVTGLIRYCRAWSKMHVESEDGKLDQFIVDQIHSAVTKRS